MKQCIFNIGLVVAFLCVSCSRGSGISDDSLFKAKTRGHIQTERDANLILVEYVKVDDNKVIYLDISQKNAELLGISKEFYNAAIENIRQTNEAVQRMIEENIPVQIAPPNLQRVSIKQTNEAVQYPSGSFSVNGNGPDDQVSMTFWAPDGMKGVNFMCKANAALTCIYRCQVSSFGVDNVGTAIGYPWEFTSISVGLAASNTYASVFFHVPTRTVLPHPTGDIDSI